jgi:hypothetical protein
VVKYSLEIEQSARKELDALDDGLFTRIDRKIRPPDLQETDLIRICGVAPKPAAVPDTVQPRMASGFSG